MKPRRTSIASLMLVVGRSALDMTFGRMIFQSEPWRLAGISLIGVIIQVGLCFLGLRSRQASPLRILDGFRAGRPSLDLHLLVCSRAWIMAGFAVGHLR